LIFNKKKLDKTTFFKNSQQARLWRQKMNNPKLNNSLLRINCLKMKEFSNPKPNNLSLRMNNLRMKEFRNPKSYNISSRINSLKIKKFTFFRNS